MRHITGYPDRPPTRIGICIGDSLAAMFATIGTLAALHHRDRTGEGQLVDTAITESVFALMESSVSEYGRVGVVRERTGNVLPKIAPSNVYPTKGGGYLVIGANQDKVFARLAQVMGRPELCEDPRYATHAARSEHQQELDALVAAWTQGYCKQELWEFLNAAGVPAGPIYSIADIFEDPQFKARGMIRTLRDEEIGEVEQPDRAAPLEDAGGSPLGGPYPSGEGQRRDLPPRPRTLRGRGVESAPGRGDLTRGAALFTDR